MTLMMTAKRVLGLDDGLCDQVRAAAADLTETAKKLTKNVNSYERAPDPFVALLSAVWNNHEFNKFPKKPTRK